jgi:hypothetical protein
VVVPASDTLAPPLDSIDMVATIRVTPRRHTDGSVELRGIVEGVTLTSGLGADRTTQSSSTPLDVVWRSAQDGVTIPAPAGSECGSPVQSVRDMLTLIAPPLPQRVTGESSWSAALGTAGCRDSVSFSSSTDAAFRPEGAVAAARQLGRLTIVATGVTRVEGRGRLGVTNITLRGSGPVNASYVVDAATGQLQSASASSVIQLEFDLGYRTDRFVQKSVRTAARVN